MDFEALIAGRMGQIDSSGIRKVFDLAKQLRNPINLSIGQPDFDVPEPIKARAMHAIETGHNKYTVTQGLAELRRAVLRQEKRESGISHDSVLITSGVSGGLLLAFMALINPGDRVAIPDPYFVMYKHLCRLLGGEPLFVDTYPDFRLTPQRLEQAGAAEAKLLLLNSPCNPTGRVMPDKDMREVANWAAANDVFVISDEIYRAFCYGGRCPSAASFTEELILLNGFSKSCAMTGWRLGYAIGPEPIIAQMAKLQQFSFVCAPSIAQYAGMVAVSMSPERHVRAYQAKRDILYEGLRDRFNLQRPEGAFYAFVEAPGGDGAEFCRRAIERNVLVIPGSVFSERNTHFRISFAADDSVIEEGVTLLCALAEETR
ncbi:MAG: aminotransferase class I/II-fold pyridoxal phosphate-dependent enzyme [Candidatus Brocadiia bacterium]